MANEHDWLLYTNCTNYMNEAISKDEVTSEDTLTAEELKYLENAEIQRRILFLIGSEPREDNLPLAHGERRRFVTEEIADIAEYLGIETTYETKETMVQDICERIGAEKEHALSRAAEGASAFVRPGIKAIYLAVAEHDPAERDSTPSMCEQLRIEARSDRIQLVAGKARIPKREALKHIRGDCDCSNDIDPYTRYVTVAVETCAELRQQVQNGKPRGALSEDMGVPYTTLCEHVNGTCNHADADVGVEPVQGATNG